MSAQQCFACSRPWKSETVKQINDRLRIDKTYDKYYDERTMEFYGKAVWVWYEVVLDDHIVEQYKTMTRAREEARYIKQQMEEGKI